LVQRNTIFFWHNWKKKSLLHRLLIFILYPLNRHSRRKRIQYWTLIFLSQHSTLSTQKGSESISQFCPTIHLLQANPQPAKSPTASNKSLHHPSSLCTASHGNHLSLAMPTAAIVTTSFILFPPVDQQLFLLHPQRRQHLHQPNRSTMET
jgi:hypothetical protein